jgi:hypothetical protein
LDGDVANLCVWGLESLLDPWQIASAGRVLSDRREQRQVGSRGSDQPGAAVIVAWEWTSCLSPHGGDAHDRGGNITNRTRANWQAYRKYLLDS